MQSCYWLKNSPLTHSTYKSTSKTLIDHIYTNRDSNIRQSGIVEIFSLFEMRQLFLNVANFATFYVTMEKD